MKLTSLLPFILTLSLFMNCGLIYPGVPKKGEFCYVLVKPPACLLADFEKKKLYWNEIEYDLAARTRTEYLFSFEGQMAELLVTTENRLDLKIPNETTPSKFYMRKKEKFNSLPKQTE